MNDHPSVQQNNQKRKLPAHPSWSLILIVLFLASTVIRGLAGDFPKALRIYPDELLYVSLGRSLLHGQGLQVHHLSNNFQKILYSLCTIPAFIFHSTITQIRAVGYLNSLIVSSSVFPVYKLGRSLLGSDRKTGLLLVFWAVLPTSLVSLYFMSEVTFLPLSLWLIYCVWSILCTESFPRKLGLNLLLGFLFYLAYLNKEVALYFLISYIAVCVIRIFARQTAWRQDIICLLIAVCTFLLCFLVMKALLFSGLSNPYTSPLLKNIGVPTASAEDAILTQRFVVQPEKIMYLLYAAFHNTVLAILAFGVFPVLIPLATFDRNNNESWLYLFLFFSLLIGCAVISYKITLPEEFGIRAPRQHLRYLEPLLIPFYILMLNRSERLKEWRQAGTFRCRFRLLAVCMALFVILFITLGAGGGNALIDNNTLVYYEFSARFILKSDVLLLLVRTGMAAVFIIGLYMLYTRHDLFIRLFCILFICLNILNSGIGYLACLYRYTIPEEQRAQASAANDYLHSLDGNILLISGEGLEAEDNRLFDTYVDRNFYITGTDLLEADGFLEDAVLDLTSESLRCDYPYRYYADLDEIHYLVVKDRYDIHFPESTVEELPDFPLEGYHLYRNLAKTAIYFE